MHEELISTAAERPELNVYVPRQPSTGAGSCVVGTVVVAPGKRMIKFAAAGSLC
jgi:hypothetical protein